MKTFKPMLSATVDDVSLLKFPLLASPKLDGIRALVIDGKLVSRNLKPIPNKYLQEKFGKVHLSGYDGELICGDPCAEDCFRKTSSAVMSIDGEPDVQFWVFDIHNHPDLPFFERCLIGTTKKDVKVVSQALLENLSQLEDYEKAAVSSGYEGVMLRSPDALYKYGRSTFSEHGLMKLKRFEDAEAIIIGFEEQMHNTNEATKDKLGATARSSKKAGMVGKDTLGALIVRGVNGEYKGKQFNVGSGFTDAQREEIWGLKSVFVGKIIKYKYFPIGGKDAPRFPVYLWLAI